jgi:hypothetical protein
MCVSLPSPSLIIIVIIILIMKQVPVYEEELRLLKISDEVKGSKLASLNESHDNLKESLMNAKEELTRLRIKAADNEDGICIIALVFMFNNKQTTTTTTTTIITTIIIVVLIICLYIYIQHNV